MSEDDWPAVSEFISTEWEANHPVLNKDFFFWQHRGFGAGRGVEATPLAFSNGQLVGMRGVIPGEYQVPRGSGGYEYARGGAFAMWLVAKEMRGQGVGRQLLAHCETHLPVMLALGSNENTSVPIYLRNGFSRLDGLDHWYTLLSENARGLVFGEGEESPLFPSGRGKKITQLQSTTNAEYLAALWNDFSTNFPLFSLRRTGEFWKWRYLNHPVFDYEILHDPELGIAAVQRLEEVDTSDGRLRVMRLVELVAGQSAGGRKRRFDEAVETFLRSLLLEARARGIDAADLRLPNGVFGQGLIGAGLQLMQRGAVAENGNGFAGRLNPLLLAPSPINLHWKTALGRPFSGSGLYFTKSDSDMDRPNARGQRSPRLDY